MARSPISTDLGRRLWDLSDLLINTSGAGPAVASAVTARHADHDAIITALRRRDQKRPVPLWKNTSSTPIPS
jgi:hypothetical protein